MRALAGVPLVVYGRSMRCAWAQGAWRRRRPAVPFCCDAGVGRGAAQVTIDFEPFKPINTSLYLCDNKFHVEARPLLNCRVSLFCAAGSARKSCALLRGRAASAVARQ